MIYEIPRRGARTAARTFCQKCGRPAQRATVKQYRTGRAPWPETALRPTRRGEYTRILWDGVSYLALPYGAGNFCTMRCAEAFAAAAVEAGYTFKR